MAPQPTPRPTATDGELDALNPETVEDLDAEEDAEDVRGGTTWLCPNTQ